MRFQISNLKSEISDFRRQRAEAGVPASAGTFEREPHCTVPAQAGTPRNPHRITRRSGFTLVEVLATLVLIGIVLPVAMQAISVALKTSSTARRQLEAATLAETKLEEILATGEWQFGVLSGDFGEDWPGYQWEAQVLQRETETLNELIVHVTWDGRGGEQGIQVATLVYLTGFTDEGAESGLGGSAQPGGGP